MDGWTECRQTRSMRVLLDLPEDPEKDADEIKRGIKDLTAGEIQAGMEQAQNALFRIASFKKRYKGTSISVLKEVATLVGTASRELARRNPKSAARWRKKILD